MKTLYKIAACVLCLALPYVALAQSNPLRADGTLSSAGQAVALNLMDYVGIGVQVTGTCGTCTLQFEVTVDGTNWVAANMTPPDSTTAATSTTATGVWGGGMVGSAFRVRMSARSSGSFVVTIRGVPSSARSGGGGGGPVDVITGGPLIAGCVPYATGAQTVACEAAFAYNAATDTLSAGKIAVANVNISGAVPFVSSAGLLIDVDPNALIDTHLSILGTGVNPPYYDVGFNVGVNSAALNMRLYYTDSPGFEMQFTPYEIAATQTFSADPENNYFGWTLQSDTDAAKITSIALHKYDVADGTGYFSAATDNTLALGTGAHQWSAIYSYAYQFANGGALRTDTTTTHTACFASVYDVDGAVYVCGFLGTNANTPTLALSAPTGGTLSVNATTLQKGGVDLNPVLTGTTGSIGGGALLAGACTSGTVAVTNSTTSMTVSVSANTYPGDGSQYFGYVSVNGTVTVKVCALVALTPVASTYNVRVTQ